MTQFVWITHIVRHVERRLPMSGRERGPGCHPERSEGSRSPDEEILRCAQDDSPYLQMSIYLKYRLTKSQQSNVSAVRQQLHSYIVYLPEPAGKSYHFLPVNRNSP